MHQLRTSNAGVGDFDHEDARPGLCDQAAGSVADPLRHRPVTPRCVAIDPGPVESGVVLFDGMVLESCTLDNEVLLRRIYERYYPPAVNAMVFEEVRNMGMQVGRSIFTTVFWTGRFYEAARIRGFSPLVRIPRVDVKRWVCGTVRAKDKDVRQALIRRFGGDTAIGKKSHPGPLYGVSGDAWSALALACTWWDKVQTNG